MTKKHVTIVIFILVIFAVTIGIILQFIVSEQKLQTQHEIGRLEENTFRNSTIAHNLLNEYAETLRALTLYIKDYEDLRPEESIRLLQDIAVAFDFDRLYIDFATGVSYTTDGVTCNMQDDQYLDAIRSGLPFITDVVTSAIDDTPRIRVHVPLVPGESTLSFSMPLEQLRERMMLLLPDNYRYFYIIDGNGNVVCTNIDSLFASTGTFNEILDQVEFNEGYSKETMRSEIHNATPCYVEYIVDGMERYVYYAPVGINQWTMFTVMPSEYVHARTESFVSRSLMLSFKIVLVLIVVAAIVFWEQKRLRTILELDECCFRILAEYTGKVILEWDHENKTMHITNFEKSYHRKHLSMDTVLHYDPNTSDEVHPDDSEVFRQIHQDIARGRNVENARIRLLGSNGEYLHHSLSAVVVTQANGKPYKSIGFIENIDEQVRKEEYLRLKAETDLLTGFYNKTTAEQVITNILKDSPSDLIHALICLDLDNFKSINDSFGHLYGDKVLMDLANALHGMFRKSDILGRFGGDEFIIFLPDVPGRMFMEEKAAELNRIVNRTYSEGGISETISASIGIAMFPTNGTSYKTLYEKADEASYHVKNTGKNSYSFAK